MDIKVAITQKPPVLLDLEASLTKALATLEEAASNGANIIVFPEAYLPGYPTWIWRLSPGKDMALGNTIHAKLRANSVDIDAGDLDPLCELAKQLGVVVVMGMNEIDSVYSGTTLYNTLVVIGIDGRILNRHRKMMPTNPERMVWGMGDASGLRVVETPYGRLGTLICWENYMPLARYALFSEDIDIYVAPTWDSGEVWHSSMHHIAREGGCWVLSTATAMTGSDIPDDFPERDSLFDPEEWINPGDAVVIKPFGGVHAGPMYQEKDILYADIDLEDARRSRKAFDVAGHYSRPDLFRVEVDRSQKPPIKFTDDVSDQ